MTPLEAYKKKLDEIIESRRKATPGEFKAFECGSWGGQGFGIAIGENIDGWFCNKPTDNSSESAYNSIFLALAANHFAQLAKDNLMLIGALEKFTYETERVETECDGHSAYYTYHIDMNTTRCPKCGNDSDGEPKKYVEYVSTQRALEAKEALQKLGGRK